MGAGGFCYVQYVFITVILLLLQLLQITTSYSYESFDSGEGCSQYHKNSRSPYKAASARSSGFFSSSRNPDKLLEYSGQVRENILEFGYLDDALEHLNAPQVPHRVILAIFEYVRDRTYFPNTTGVFEERRGEILVGNPKENQHTKSFRRRLTWFYPDDGCMTRAEFMSIWADDVIRVHQRMIHKFFIFGRLRVKTRFSRNGLTKWVYHVAPLMHSRDAGYVILDPALNFHEPLPLKEWILLQSGGLKSMTEAAECLIGFTIANRFAYNTRDNCDNRKSRFDPDRIHENVFNFVKDSEWIQSLLNDEWNRVAHLGAEPRRILGQSPLWKKQRSNRYDDQFY